MSDQIVSTNSPAETTTDLDEEFGPVVNAAHATPAGDIGVLPPSGLIGPELPPVNNGEIVTNNLPVGSQFTPQALIRFFPLDKNKQVIVPAPVEFTPPSPPPSRGSSATYESR